ncbi:MAG: cytochrome c oxidase assembly protein [Candidatus Longimicrobiales bacterium M2_2A_002]
MGDLQAFLLSWTFEPTIFFGVLIAGWLYARGWRRLRQRGQGGKYLKRWRAWCYYGGLLTVVIALMSPIATFDSVFFFMHMTEHVLLIMIAAPLIWLGAPMVPTLWGFNAPARKRIGKIFHESHPVNRFFTFLTRPGVALAIYVLVLFGWHFPPLYDAAQGSTVVHELEHFMFIAAALIFWWPVIHPSGTKRRLSYGAGILFIFPAKIAGFVLGAALTLSSEPFYQTFLDSPSIWGLSPLGDQQLGGLIMWVAGGLLYIIPLLALVIMMMREDEGDVWIPEAVRTGESAQAGSGTGPARPRSAAPGPA